MMPTDDMKRLLDRAYGVSPQDGTGRALLIRDLARALEAALAQVEAGEAKLLTARKKFCGLAPVGHGDYCVCCGDHTTYVPVENRQPDQPVAWIYCVRCREGRCEIFGDAAMPTPEPGGEER